MDIIEKMYQLQALRKLTKEIENNIVTHMNNNIEVEPHSYNSGFTFNKISNNNVIFTGWNKYSGDIQNVEFELSIDEFKEIISGKKELEYKHTS